MAELVRRSLRMNPSRVIVGEVLGDEIVTMLNAMSQGNDGSLSTIHANSSLEVFNRIATYAIQSQERLPVDATHMLIGGAIDFVVFVQKRNEYAQGGRLRRFVSSVREVTGVDGRVMSSEVFAPDPDGRAVPHAPASCIDDLAEYGYVAARAGALVNGLGSASRSARRPARASAGGGALLLLVLALRGLPPPRPAGRSARLEAPGPRPHRAARRARPGRGCAGAAGHPLDRRRIGAVAAGPRLAQPGRRGPERRAMARLEALATWTESLRDTIAGAVGLEQAIPASARAAAPSLQEPLSRLVNRLHTRVPMADALRRFADDLDDPSADLIIAALIINARLRGPGLRDLLGALSASVREELDMRRKVNARARGPPGAARRSWSGCPSAWPSGWPCSTRAT